MNFDSQPEAHKYREILSNYKRRRCKKPDDQCKFKTFAPKDIGEIVALCTAFHNIADERRNPFLDMKSSRLGYTYELCEKFDSVANSCPHRDCTKCRNSFEFEYHPDNFKKSSCPYFESKNFCRLGVKCFRFHEKNECEVWRKYWDQLKDEDARNPEPPAILVNGDIRERSSTATSGNSAHKKVHNAPSRGSKDSATLAKEISDTRSHGSGHHKSKRSSRTSGHGGSNANVTELLTVPPKDGSVFRLAPPPGLRRTSCPTEVNNSAQRLSAFVKVTSDEKGSSAADSSWRRSSDMVKGSKRLSTDSGLGGVIIAPLEKDQMVRNLKESLSRLSREEREKRLKTVEDRVHSFLKMYKDYLVAIEEYRERHLDDSGIAAPVREWDSGAEDESDEEGKSNDSEEK